MAMSIGFKFGKITNIECPGCFLNDRTVTNQGVFEYDILHGCVPTNNDICQHGIPDDRVPGDGDIRSDHAIFNIGIGMDKHRLMLNNRGQVVVSLDGGQEEFMRRQK